MNWNVVVQIQSPSTKGCERLTLAGLPRPCRILIVACDATADAAAIASYQHLLAQLRSKSTSYEGCGGSIYPGCMAELEPACEHILVPVIARLPISPARLQVLYGWIGTSGRRMILPALAGGLSHSQVFANAPTAISRLQLVPWGGDPKRLAALIAQRALYGERPGLFISYRRQEAAAVADQIFDAMTHRGFRVFLDRFSGTSGRLFPQEIAEEIADRDVVLVLETPGMLQSRWTLWEIAFASLYRLGLLALRWPSAPRLPPISTRNRLNISPGSGGSLSGADLDRASAFIERGHTLAALTRRAFYEALIEAAAFSKKGTIRPMGDGVVEVLNQKNASRGLIVPSGRPGSLAAIRPLVQGMGGSSKLPRLLAGQHEHLRPSAYLDLDWLAGTVGVQLCGRADVYKRVRALV
jgi:hypothetical protein